MTRINHHCCVVEIAGHGILIEGVSGSGKSSLTLGLVERAAQSGLRADLVADDQVLLDSRNGALIASAPSATAGLVELRGYGVVGHPSIAASEVRLVVRLVADEKLERMPSSKTTRLLEHELPLLNVPARHEEAAARIVLAWVADRL